MVDKIYSGESEGFSSLVEGYISYANEVILRRSVPHIADGLKPVQRRILDAARSLKAKPDQMQKSVTFIGETIKRHPHGDSSIASAMYKMVDNNGSMNVPPLQGQGNFGQAWSSSSPADPRYTNVTVDHITEEFYRDIDGVQFVEGEIGGTEPEYLPVTFPNILTCATDGIAVGVATRMPNYNFHEVLDYVESYIKTGILGDVLIPDYPTGGMIVNTQNEFRKIVATGRGRIKLRSHIEIEGKDIVIKSVPYGNTLEQILNNIKKAEIDGVTEVSNLSGFDGIRGVVECRSAAATETVLQEIMRNTGVQKSISINMISVMNNKPVINGVRVVVNNWIEIRKAAIRKKFRAALDGVQKELTNLDYFIRLVEDIPNRDKYLELVVNGKDADAFLITYFGQIPEDAVKWIFDRRAKEFHKGGKYRARRDSLLADKELYESYVRDPKLLILEDIQRLRETYKGKYQRLTEITNEDVQFRRVAEPEYVEQNIECTYTITDEGYIYKTRDRNPNIANARFQVQAGSTDTLVGFDAEGRLLRVYGEDISYNKGVYLGAYAGTGDARWMWFDKLDGRTHMLIYKDGYVGYLDTSEWVENKRKVRLLDKGVSPEVGEQLLEVLPLEEVGKQMWVFSNTPSGYALGIAITEDFIRKGRKSRTKIYNGANRPGYEISAYGFTDNPFKAVQICGKVEKFLGRVKLFDIEDDKVDLDALGAILNQGTY